MSLVLLSVLGYSTGNDTREDLQLKWQCQFGTSWSAQLMAWKRARGGDVSRGEDGEMEDVT